MELFLVQGDLVTHAAHPYVHASSTPRFNCQRSLSEPTAASTDDTDLGAGKTTSLPVRARLCLYVGGELQERTDAHWEVDFEENVITYKGRHYYEGIVGKHMNTIIPGQPRMGILLSSLRVMLFSVQGKDVSAWTISHDRGSMSELERSSVVG